MWRTIMPLPFSILLCLLLAACAAEPFKPCEVSVVGVRPGAASTARLLSALLDQGNAGPGGLDLVVSLKVTNPNGREVVLHGLSGVVSGPGGALGAFRLPEGKLTTLPARGSTVVELLAEPGADFLKGALSLLLSPSDRGQLTATGHADVDSWLGMRRVEFKNVRLGGGGGS